jgi:predicted DNA-binding WGR domain protein
MLINIFVTGIVRIIIFIDAFNSEKYTSVNVYLFDINNKLIQSWPVLDCIEWNANWRISDKLLLSDSTLRSSSSNTPLQWTSYSVRIRCTLFLNRDKAQILSYEQVSVHIIYSAETQNIHRFWYQIVTNPTVHRRQIVFKFNV